MRRDDLAWALGAVLPHAGRSFATNLVGMEHHNGRLVTYATDMYTIGAAHIADDSAGSVYVTLSPAETRELLRFIKPTVKAHDSETVEMLVRGNELHIGIDGDSAVFDLIEHSLTLSLLTDQMVKVRDAHPNHDVGVYSPALFAKFAKAQRHPTDRLRLYPRLPAAALVTIGDSFIGAIAGMRTDEMFNDDNTLTLLTPDRTAA